MVENATHKEGQKRMKETIILEKRIWLGSNRGLKTQDELFGWVIATATNIIWENNGCVTGNRNVTETLRVESFGLLSAIVFIQLCTNYHDVAINPNKVIHSCNNMGVVQQMKWMEIISLQNPNDCLMPDYNVQAQIEETYKAFGTSF
eukprot:11730248-Ditylum_brightwellii.AAC.2